MADDEKKIEVTLLSDVRVDNKTIGRRGETHAFGVGTGTMLINSNLGVDKDGRAEVEKMVAEEKKKAAADKAAAEKGTGGAGATAREKELADENAKLKAALAVAQKTTAGG